jgi:hypothetical protein
MLNYLMKHAGVIPIAGKNEDNEIFERAFQKIKISECLSQGDLACITKHYQKDNVRKRASPLGNIHKWTSG